MYTENVTDFKVGQKVKIIRKTESHTKGWTDWWVEPYMTNTIGLTGVVRSVSKYNNEVVVGKWAYPPRSLEIIDESNSIYIPKTQTVIETKPNVSVPKPLVATAVVGMSLRPRKSEVAEVAVKIGKKFGVVNAGLIQSELVKLGLFAASGATIASVLAGDSRFKNTGAQVNSKYGPARGRKVTQWEYVETPAEVKPNVSAPTPAPSVSYTSKLVELTPETAKVGVRVQVGPKYPDKAGQFGTGNTGVISSVCSYSYPVRVKFDHGNGVYDYHELLVEVPKSTKTDLKVGDKVRLSEKYLNNVGNGAKAPWSKYDTFTVVRIDSLSQWPIRIQASDNSFGLVTADEIEFV